MKFKYNFFKAAILLLMVIPASCKKDQVGQMPAICQVFNALDNDVHLRPKLSFTRPSFFSTALDLKNRDSTLLYTMITLSEFPQPLQLFTFTDTLPEDKPVLSTTLDVKAGENYSLFLYGQKNSVTHTLIHNEIPRINYRDSSTIIRFANFSSTPEVSINVKGEPVGSLIQRLSTRSVSAFKILPLNQTTHQVYDLEIRDIASEEIIATYKIMAAIGSTTKRWWLWDLTTLVLNGHAGEPAPNHLRVSSMFHE